MFLYCKLDDKRDSLKLIMVKLYYYYYYCYYYFTIISINLFSLTRTHARTPSHTHIYIWGVQDVRIKFVCAILQDLTEESG